MAALRTDASPIINDWDISNVTTFGDMFGGCSSHPEFTKRTGTWDKYSTSHQQPNQSTSTILRPTTAGFFSPHTTWCLGNKRKTQDTVEIACLRYKRKATAVAV